MGEVVRLATGSGDVTLSEAVRRFLRTFDHDRQRATKLAYERKVCKPLLEAFGEDATLASLTADSLADWFAGKWQDAKPSTWNTGRYTLSSLLRFCEEQDWIPSAARLLRGIRPRKMPPDRTRALSRAEVEALLTSERVPLRERTLWRMLYETAARSAEVLRLNAEDLDMPNRCARVCRKGGAADVIVWQTGTARLLPRLLKGRKQGPLFLTEKRSRVEVSPADRDPASGLARLSYERAEQLFKQHSGGKTLHQLRHSALTHDAEEGTNTPMLMTRSGHTSVRSLAKYARPSAEALMRHQAERDPARRR